MELFLLIFIIVVVSNLKNNGNRARKDNGRRNGNSVWDQVDKGSENLLKNFTGSKKAGQVNSNIRDFEDAMNHWIRKAHQQMKQKEEASYQQDQEARRKKEEEERKRRDQEELRKKQLELKKKEAEQRRKILEKEKREREEKALLEHCQVTKDKGCDVHKDVSYTTSTEKSMQSSAGKVSASEHKQDDMTVSAGYRVEEYLDPLTASFYPKVDDYLFPTIASFYPDTNISFSLQNETDVL